MVESRFGSLGKICALVFITLFLWTFDREALLISVGNPKILCYTKFKILTKQSDFSETVCRRSAYFSYSRIIIFQERNPLQIARETCVSKQSYRIDTCT